MEIQKKDILFVVAGKGVFYTGASSEGFKIYNPYVQHNMFERILRELCFKSSILPNMWFNKKVIQESPRYVVVIDPLITKKYLKWLHVLFPHAQLNFVYANIVGHAKHLYPKDIPPYYRIWTYNEVDSKKYGIRLYHTNPYFRSFIREKKEPEYDVIYVGADKGRGDYLVALEKEFNRMGLKTKFIITADSKLAKKKAYYHHPVPYTYILDLLSKSKAVLNVPIGDLRGITMRDLESIFFNIKLITTSQYIKCTDFYNPHNIFILNEENVAEIRQFMSIPLKPVPDIIKKRYTIESYLREILS